MKILNSKLNVLAMQACVAALILFISCEGYCGDSIADVVRVFRDAQALHNELRDTSDGPLRAAVNDLGEMVDNGNRLLTKNKLQEARYVAEQVVAQMELVIVLGRLLVFKKKLEVLQKKTEALSNEKRTLESQYRRLLLHTNGRALTGAYPEKPAVKNLGEN